MKSFLAFFILMHVSAVSVASSARSKALCDQAAIQIAKANLDLKAKAYGFDSGFVLESSLKKTADLRKMDFVSYGVEGFIYRASYNINLVLDSSCGLISLSIEE